MYLGLDLGTSELKALLLDEHHQVVATAASPLSVNSPQPLWSEQDPNAWWQATLDAVQQLQTSHPQAVAQVKAVGLSGQMHGAVLLDAAGAVLRPVMLWNDGRSFAQCEQLSHAVPNLAQITGNLAMPGFTAPKLLWVAQHEPDLFERCATVLLPKDWLRYKLSGALVSDMSDAAGTLWLDVGQRDWSDTVLQACQLTRAHMPSLVEGSAPSGRVWPELAERWGMTEPPVIAGGAGDNAASAVGMGLVRPGEGFVSLGTSGVVFVSGATFAPNPAQALHAFCHAIPERWHQMSVMLSAASALTWAKDTLGLPNEAELLTLAATLGAPERAAAPVFLPYLNGERSPHNNAHACGVWFGLGRTHTAAHLAYSVAEGVGFGLRDGLHTLQQPLPATLSVVGGGTRSPWWLQLLADVLDVALTLHSGAQTGAALGAARLAWLAHIGDTPEHINNVCTTPPVTQTFSPNAQAQATLLARYVQFQALYTTLKPHMQA
jgi:xylulokinase